MLTWIQTQAKWVIVIGIVFISAGLLLVDQQNLQTPSMEPVAVINGKKIDYSEFQGQYASRARGLGGQESEQEKAQLRRRILNEYAQRDGLRQSLEELAITGSDIEAYQHVMMNPPSQIKQMEQFMTDSVFDPSKWASFYMSDSAVQMQGLRGLEQQVKANTIPMNQLSMFISMGVQTTDLEARFKIGNAKNRYKLQYVSTPLDSFDVDKVTDEEIESYFQTANDSFYVKEDQAKAVMVYLPIKPTEKDFEIQKEIAQDFLYELKNGVSFEKVALNSDDQATASKGGSLGDFQSGMLWPKALRKAAIQLDSGEISGVIRSRLGFHVVKSDGKRVEGGDTLMKISHILTKVIAGTETLADLKTRLETQHSELETTPNWEEYARENSLNYKTTNWFQRGGVIDEGYFSGLSSFIFSDKSKDGISDVISNDAYVAIFKEFKKTRAGERLKAPHAAAIRKYVKKDKQERAALKYLKDLELPQKNISNWVSSQRKIQYDTTGFVGLESSVSRFGFANPHLGRIFKSNKNEWIRFSSGRYAFMARWVESQPALSQQYERELTQTKQNIGQRSRQMASTLWMNSLIDQAQVEENLYQYYSE